VNEFFSVVVGFDCFLVLQRCAMLRTLYLQWTTCERPSRDCVIRRTLTSVAKRENFFSLSLCVSAFHNVFNTRFVAEIPRLLRPLEEWLCERALSTGWIAAQRITVADFFVYEVLVCVIGVVVFFLCVIGVFLGCVVSSERSCAGECAALCCAQRSCARAASPALVQR
jgi:hypothetical protein